MVPDGVNVVDQDILGEGGMTAAAEQATRHLFKITTVLPC